MTRRTSEAERHGNSVPDVQKSDAGPEKSGSQFRLVAPQRSDPNSQSVRQGICATEKDILAYFLDEGLGLPKVVSSVTPKGRVDWKRLDVRRVLRTSCTSTTLCRRTPPSNPSPSNGDAGSNAEELRSVSDAHCPQSCRICIAISLYHRLIHRITALNCFSHA